MDNIAAVQLLADIGADINAKNAKDRSVLYNGYALGVIEI